MSSRHNLLWPGVSLAIFGSVVSLAPTSRPSLASPGSGARHLAASSPAQKARLMAAYGRLPLEFEVNQGQAARQVKFLCRTGQASILLTGKSMVLAMPASHASRSHQVAHHSSRSTRLATVLVQLLGAHPASVSGEGLMPDKSNYFIGKNPAKWRTGVSHYAKVRCQNVYPGIDVVYYGNHRQLEHDFIVNPGASPADIRLNIQGASGLLRVAKDGSLQIPTAAGPLALRKPALYQMADGKRVPVDGGYQLGRDRSAGIGQVRFRVGSFDHRRALVIDPVVVYSTYLGGSGADGLGNGVSIGGGDLTIDASGAAYITQATASSDFPVTTPLQTVNAGGYDAFVSKISPDGSRMVYSTYLGGSGDDNGVSIALDSTGAAYVVGQTSSPDFPTTTGAMQTTYGGAQDGFVAKISADGSKLVYSTYIGGSSSDSAAGVAVDASGNAYVSGSTSSTDFPVTGGALQGTYAGGGSDAYIAKLSPTGTRLVYCTYLGGSGDDVGGAIAIDRSGHAYVSGDAASTDFPTTAGVFQPGYGGGQSDAFVAKLNPTGAKLVYASYLGGSGLDNSFSLAVDNTGSAYVTGATSSFDFPTTAGAFQPAYGGGTFDAYVAKISTNGSSLIYCSYLGGSDYEDGHQIAIDSSGQAYLVGLTASTDFPTVSPIQAVYGGGSWDAYLVKISSDGSSLLFSTYLGGSGWDEANGVAVDNTGMAYVMGDTSSADFPTTLGALQPSYGGGANDAFVAKINAGVAPAPPVNLTGMAVSRTEIDLSWAGGDSTATSFTIERQSGFGAFVPIATVQGATLSYKDMGLTTNTSYTYQVSASNAAGASPYSNQITVSTLPLPPLAISGLSATVASATEVDLLWNDANGDQTGFQILRATGNSTVFIPIANIDGGLMSYADTTVQPLTTYTYKVEPTNAGGAGPATQSPTVTTPAIPPAAASNLAATPISSTQILLQWVDNSSTETGFKVLQSSGGSAPTVAATTAANVTSVLVGGLTQTTAYTFQVLATDLGTDSTPSNSVTAYPLPNVPAAPTNLTAYSVSPTEIDLAWIAGDATATGYLIERAGVTGAFSQIAAITGTLTTYADTALTPNTVYRYRIQATNALAATVGLAAGSSAYSNVSTAATPLTPPTAPLAPSNLIATATGATQVTLTWTDNSTNETAFLVERMGGATSSSTTGATTSTTPPPAPGSTTGTTTTGTTTTTAQFVQVAAEGPNITAFVDTGLVANTLYSYRIRATNAGGNSAYSNIATVTIGSDTIHGTVATVAGTSSYPLAGATVQLFTTTSTAPVATTTTDTNGSFTFAQLIDGTYTVTVQNGGLPQSQTVTVNGLTGSGTAVASLAVSPAYVFPQGVSMVSVPYDYSSTSVDAASLFGLTALPSGVLPLVIWSPSSSQYLFYPNLPGGNGKQPVPGRCYWIKETGPQPFLTPGAVTQSPFSEALYPGWNMIGDPFTSNVDLTLLQFSVPVQVGATAANSTMNFQAALINQVVQSPIWSYSAATGAYTQATTLQPFLGYWVYVNPQVVQNNPITINFTRFGS